MYAVPKGTASYAPIAQLDRASVYGTEGWGFELLWAHHAAYVILLTYAVIFAVKSDFVIFK